MKHAKTRDDFLNLNEMRTLSGLDFMQGILEGRVTGPTICPTMNFDLHIVERGRIVFRGTPEFGHLNPFGGTHGGWYGVLLDSCMSCAVHTEIPAGRGYTTLEYKVNITRAIPQGLVDRIRCRPLEQALRGVISQPPRDGREHSEMRSRSLLRRHHEKEQPYRQSVLGTERYGRLRDPHRE